MNSESEILEKRKKWIKNKINFILKNKYSFLFGALIIFTIAIKIYYFYKTLNQAIWWDEGDYLAIAKELFSGGERPEWWSHFSGMRPLLMPVIWGFLFLINFSEPIVRFITLLIPSILTIILTYSIGRDLYNKRIGLIASLMLSAYWVHSFYTYRLLTDIPAMFFGTLSIYFFWSKYIKENKNWGLYLSIIFGVMAFATRFPLALVLISIFLYLFITNGFKLFKDKTFLKGAGFGILSLSPYLIYFIINKFQVFSFYFGETAVSIKTPILEAAKTILPLIPEIMKDYWFWLLIIGILTLYKLIIGFDLVLKQKTKSLNADLFVALLTVTHLFFYIIILRAANDRWLLMLMLPLFLLSAKGLTTIQDLIEKHGKKIIKDYAKLIGIIFVIVVLSISVTEHLKHGDGLIKQKLDSYQEEKLAGLWLKENTPKDAKIIISSIVQNQYYSERQSYDFYNQDVDLKECFDLYGKLNETEECFNKSEQAFRDKVKKIDADYLVIHVFEPVFTPQWAYTYPERHLEELTPIQAYVDSNNNPLLVIYKFNKESDLFS